MEHWESPRDKKKKVKLSKEGNMYGDYRIISGKHLGKMGLAESKECLLWQTKKKIKQKQKGEK